MAVQLNVAPRDPKVSAQKLRDEGKLVGVFYGPKEEATPVTIDMPEFLRVWNDAGGSTIVDLVGIGDDKEVLIHEVDVHPVTEKPQHVDFYCIERGKKLTVSVPLVFTGTAPAEKQGGIVVKALHELEIEVRPRDIPHEIEVDLSTLTELDSSITVGDLRLGEGVEPTAEAEETVASITEAKDEPEEEEERDISDVEIEGEKPDEDTNEESTEDE